MQPLKAHARRAVALFVPALALLFGACNTTPRDAAPAPSGATATQAPAAATQAASAAATAGATGAAAPPAAREALCARFTDCYIEVAKQAEKERAGSSPAVDAAADKIRAKQQTRCMALTEQAAPEALSSCMKLECKPLLPCVAKMGKAN